MYGYYVRMFARATRAQSFLCSVNISIRLINIWWPFYAITCKMSDLCVDLSVIYVDLSDHYVDLSEKYHYN